MKSERPKQLHPLLGRRLVDWPVEAARAVGPDRLVLVISPGTEDELAGDWETAVQPVARGTGDAAATGLAALGDFDGDVLVLPGDGALLTAATLKRLVETHRAAGAAVTLLTVETDEPLPYGRIVRDRSGKVARVVEERDATDEERAIRELNSSVYVFAAADLRDGLAQLDTENDQGELYLTDAIGHLAPPAARSRPWPPTTRTRRSA